MTILKFLLWHYSSGIVGFFRNWKNFLSFVWYYFGIKIHLFSLFSSWHRDISRVPQAGFHPVLLLESFLENIFTRLIGSLARLTVIGLALVLEIILLLGGLALFIAWIVWPVILVISSVSLATANSLNLETLAWVLAFLINLLTPTISFSSFANKRKNILR